MIGTQKGTIILTTTHIPVELNTLELVRTPYTTRTGARITECFRMLAHLAFRKALIAAGGEMAATSEQMMDQNWFGDVTIILYSGDLMP